MGVCLTGHTKTRKSAVEKRADEPVLRAGSLMAVLPKETEKNTFLEERAGLSHESARKR